MTSQFLSCMSPHHNALYQVYLPQNKDVRSLSLARDAALSSTLTIVALPRVSSAMCRPTPLSSAINTNLHQLTYMNHSPRSSHTMLHHMSSKHHRCGTSAANTDKQSATDTHVGQLSMPRRGSLEKKQKQQKNKEIMHQPEHNIYPSSHISARNTMTKTLSASRIHPRSRPEATGQSPPPGRRP